MQSILSINEAYSDILKRLAALLYMNNGKSEQSILYDACKLMKSLNSNLNHEHRIYSKQKNDKLTDFLSEEKLQNVDCLISSFEEKGILSI